MFKIYIYIIFKIKKQIIINFERSFKFVYYFIKYYKSV